MRQRYLLSQLERLRRVFMLLLSRFGYLVGYLLINKPKSKVFLFYRNYQIGGAEFVHLDIAAAIKHLLPVIIFTERSPKDNNLLSAFKTYGTVYDLASYTINPFLYCFLQGIVAHQINRAKEPITLGSNSSFYYRMLPLLNKKVRRYDLVHAFDGKNEEIHLPYIEYLDKRVVINRKTIEDIKAQYQRTGIDKRYFSRVHLIENGIKVTSDYQANQHHPLHVLYVGRSTSEKRIYLIKEIADRVNHETHIATFQFMGDMGNYFSDSKKPSYLQLFGEVRDSQKKDEIYKQADVLILTSEREGFPMVIMEAMMNGVIPLTTNVGGIPYHVTDQKNGLLINSNNEQEIVKQMSDWITRLNKDQTLFTHLSRQAYEYAHQHFTIEQFQKNYRNLFSY